MPPPRGEIWNQFIELKDQEGKVVSVTCKHCDQDYAFPNATRMTRHIVKKCKKCPNTIKAAFSVKNKDQDTDTDNEECREDNPGPAANSSLVNSSKRATGNNESALPVKRQKSIISCMDVISKEEKNKLDLLFARALLSKGLSFSVFEGEYMETAFHALRPAYKLPSRKTFAGPLLDKEYERVMESVKSDISKARALTIETDGWTNTRSEGIVNFLVCTPKPYFYSAVEPGIQREDANFIAEKLLAVINSVGAGRVLLLVTDNASAMKRAWRLVREEYSHIYTIGCGAHCLNLLFKDITKLPVFRDLISSAKDVVKIRKHRQLNAIFKSKQKLNYGESASALVLPSPTRFGGSYLMLVSLQKNKVALGETVLTDATEVPAAVKTTVLDDAFWEKMSFFLRFMKPVVEGTHLIEADDAKLSHMVKICMKIKDLANEALNEDSVIPLGAVQRIKSAVIHRITKFCIFDIHLATYLIDPVFAGEGLSDTECQRAIEVIEAIAAHLKENTEKVVENLAQFTTKTNFYDNEKMWKRALTLNSITWWDFYCKNQPLHPIAVRLLSLLPSACPCERIWSEYGYVHNKVRNRLNNKKVEKEVAIKHNLNLSQQCSEAEKKKRAELSAEREKILKAYPSVFLFDESDSEFSEDENDPRPLWTSDEELENTSDEENEEDLENISD